MREALGVATSTHEKEVEMPPHMAEGSVRILINNSTVGQKAICLHLPSMFNDCLTRHPCWWNFVNRNSLSILTWKSGGTTAIRLGAAAPMKADKAASRCFTRLSLVYSGTQLGPGVNWSGGHSVRRLSKEDQQPMICYDLQLLSLPGCGSGSEPFRGVDVLLRGCSSSLQP